MKIFTKTILLGLFSLMALNINAQSIFPIVPGSTIAVGDDNDVLRNWLKAYGQAPKGTLLYRRSTHGASASIFHSRVDDKGPTLVVFKASNGQVFGGYTPNSWSSSVSQYRSSSEAFLFNLNSNRKASPRYPQHSIYTNNNYGPTFGGGHDIYINSSMNGGYIRPHSYNNVDGSGAYPESSTMFNLAGVRPNYSSYRYSFGAGFITEIEVYQIEYNSSAPNIQGQDITIALNANGNATITVEDIDTGTSDPDGTVTLSVDITEFTCDDLGGNGTPVSPVFVRSENQSTRSHGGGFNPNTREFYYPQWSNQTVYVYDENHNYLRSFNSGRNQIMQIWKDTDSDDHYTANWNNNNFSRWDGESTTPLWTYYGGTTAGGITTDEENAYVFRHYTNYITVLDKSNGQFKSNITLKTQQGTSIRMGTISGLVKVGDRIYLGGYDYDGRTSIPRTWAAIHVFDANTGELVESVSTSGVNVYSMAFDGEILWIDNFSNVIRGYQIAEGDGYGAGGGSNAVTVTATDPLGNTSSQTFAVTVEDNIAPTIALNGDAQMSVSSDTDPNADFGDVDPGATPDDNCAAEVEVTGTVDLATPGVYTLSYKAIDQSGNESGSVTRDVTVIDASAPEAKAGRITVELDENGNATVDPANLDNGSTDNGPGNFTYGLDRTSFDCDDLNAEGGVGGSVVNMTVVGTATIDTKSHGGGYNPNTNEFWYPEWYNNGYQTSIYIYDQNRQFLRTYNSGPTQKMQLWMDLDSETDFYSANWTGSNSQTYTKIDGNGQIVWSYNNANGNYASGISTDADYAYVLSHGGNRIDVLDKNTGQFQRTINLPGQVYHYGGLVIANEQIYIAGYANGWSTNPRDYRYVHQLDMNGNYVSSIYTNGVYTYNMAFDGETMWVSQNNSNITGIKISDGSAYGEEGVLVTLTVTDELGNSSTDEGTVEVVDLLSPTITLNGDQTIEIPQGSTFNDPGAAASDNCSAQVEIAGTVNINTLGEYNLTYTAVDDSGNKSESVTRTVTVVPANEPPVAVCQNIEVGVGDNCEGTVVATDFDGGSTDPDGDVLSLSISPAGPFAIGEHTVVLTVTDPKGESSQCESILIVKDEVKPTVVTQNVIVQLDANGEGSTTASAVDNGSSDACGISSISLSKTSFTCADIATNPNTVTLTVTDVNGNENTAMATVTVEDNVAPVAVAQNVTVQLDAQGNGSTTAQAVDNGSNDGCGIASLALSQTTFDCSHVGQNTVTLTVTDANGNENTVMATVTVEDNVAPVAVAQNVTVQLDAQGNGSTTAQAVDNGSNDACGIASLALSQTTFDCSHVGQNTVTLTVTDANGNENTVMATVTVEDNVAPVAVAQNVTVQLDAQGNGSTTAQAVDNGSNDACGIASLALSQTTFDCSHVGQNTVTLTVTDANGNENTAMATVTVEDNVAPVAVAQNVTVQLDAQGNGSTTAQAVDNGSNDACGIASLALSQTTFDCSHVGQNTVTLTVTDANGNENTAMATVTVEDNVAPVAVTQNVTVQLDAQGNGSTTAQAVDNGSNDACGIASLALSQTTFDCSHVGQNTVTLTVTDANGNENTAMATVTVEDNVAPVAVAQNVTVQLDAQGNGSTTAQAVDNGSNDACGIASLALSQTTFDCSHVGQNTVTLTVTDANGNENTAMATVTVEDNVAPVAVTQNVTVQLDAQGNGSTTAQAVDNGSNDACGIASLALSQTTFDCSHVGQNTVTLTVTDANGNENTAMATVTVEDNVAPVAVAQNVTVQLDAQGNGSTTAQAVDNGSNDACGIASLALSQTTFDCSHVGQNTVTLTVTDANGNENTVMATVTVEDNVAPVAVTQNVTVQLDAQGNGSTTAQAVDNGSNDACGIASLALSQTTFDCSHVGQNTVTLTVTDANGNENTATATVTVLDEVKPNVVTQNVIVQLDANGEGSTTAAAVDNGSSDACGISSVSLSKMAFTCDDIATNPNTVTLTVTDVNGNKNTAMATVTVEDNVAPVAVAQNVTVQLDAQGNGSTTAQAVDHGSNDACGIASLALSQTAFDCSHLGQNTVTFTVTDVNGNENTATATVTVTDEEVPSLTVPSDIFVCENEIVSYMVPVGTDNCSAITTQTMGLPLTNGSVFPLGVTTIAYTAEDPSGNSVSHSFDVTVRALPTISIVQSELDPYDQGGAIVLSADAPDAVSYDWSNAGENISTEVFTSGTYSLTIANQYGCENSASINVDYVVEDLLSAYTIIGTKEVHLHENNTVLNGGVGVLGANKKAKIDKNSVLTAATTFVMADKIEVKDGSTVTTQILGQPTVVLPTFLYGTPGNRDAKVKDNEVIMLTETSYKKVDVKKNATVIFTQPDVSIKELHVGDNSTIKFSGCTYLRVEKKMHLHKNNSFNPDNYKVIVFIEDDKADIHEGTTFNGSIYTMGKEIKVKGKSKQITYMNGFFFSEKVKSEKNVIWDWNTKSSKGCPEIIPNKSFQPNSVTNTKTDESKFDIIAYPNPYLSDFSIKLDTDLSSDISISIYDILGKQVEVHEGLDPLDVPRLGRNLSQGLYMVAITQNGHTEVIKVNKIDQ